MKKIRTLILSLVLFGSFGQAAFASSVDYYEFTIQYYGNQLYGDLFTNQNSSPSISGWQVGACGSNTSMEYALVKNGTFGDTTYGSIQTVNGNYTQPGTWYTKSWSNVATNQQMQIRLRNNASSCSTQGAGNVYN
ncbi:hypothetical protein [Paenibacillus sp. Soil787]|uniref:hypothetical protein n=1 Tax=Paenibacillus sp. Soil787 TaxID=1736411 RepID=UPI0007022FD3|nr:hypothetical protein [Paenibacillus sp. Soil787]KRF44013.1 hypothetical protein ASG93_03645 [Paenibacillus sp. Soil787]